MMLEACMQQRRWDEAHGERRLPPGPFADGLDGEHARHSEHGQPSIVELAFEEPAGRANEALSHPYAYRCLTVLAGT